MAPSHTQFAAGNAKPGAEMPMKERDGGRNRGQPATG